MSVIDEQHQRVHLPRSGMDEFWQRVEEYYARDDSLKWKYLAMFVLRETAGWELDRIARVFGHARGHVTRCLQRVQRELNITFARGREEHNGH